MPISRWSPCSPCCGNDKLVYTTSIFNKYTGDFINDLDYIGYPRTQSSDSEALFVGGYNSEKATIIEQSLGVYTIELNDPDPSGSFRIIFPSSSFFQPYKYTVDIPSRSTGYFLVDKINQALGYTAATVVKDGILGVSKIRFKLSFGLSISVPGNSIYPIDGNGVQTTQKVLIKKLTSRPAIKMFDNNGSFVIDAYDDPTRDIIYLVKEEELVHIIKDQSTIYLDQNNAASRPFNVKENYPRKTNYLSYSTVNPIKKAPENAYYGSYFFPNNRGATVIISGANRGSPINLTITTDFGVVTVNCGTDPSILELRSAINAEFSPEELIASAGGFYWLVEADIDYNRAITESNHIVFGIQTSSIEFNITTDNGTVILGNKDNLSNQFVLNHVDVVKDKTHFYYNDDFVGSNHIIADSDGIPVQDFLNRVGGGSLFEVSSETISVKYPLPGNPSNINNFDYQFLKVNTPIINSIDLFYQGVGSASGGMLNGYIGSLYEIVISSDPEQTDDLALGVYDNIGAPVTLSQQYPPTATHIDISQFFVDLYGANLVEATDKKIRVRRNFHNLLIRNYGISDYVIYNIDEDALIAKRDRSYIYSFIVKAGDRTFGLGSSKLAESSDFFLTNFRHLCELDSDGNVIKDTAITTEPGAGPEAIAPIIEYANYNGYNCLRYYNGKLYIGTLNSAGFHYYLSGGSYPQATLTICNLDLTIYKKIVIGQVVFDVVFAEDHYYVLYRDEEGLYHINKRIIATDSSVWTIEIDARAICSDGIFIYAVCNNAIDGATVHCIDKDGQRIWSSRNIYCSALDEDSYYLVSVMGDKIVATGVRKERVARRPIRRLGVSDEVVINESATHVT